METHVTEHGKKSSASIATEQHIHCHRIPLLQSICTIRSFCCQHDSMASLSWQHDSCPMCFHIRSHRIEQWCTAIAYTRTEDCYRAIRSDSVDCADLNWGWFQSYLFWSCRLCRIQLMSRKKMCNTAGLHQAVNDFKSVLCKCMRHDCSITCTARTHSCSVIDLPLCALRFLLL